MRSPALFPAVLATIRRYGWMPFTVFLAHELCAHGLDAYRRWPSVDIPLHLFGGLAIAYFLGGGLRILEARGILRPLPAWVRMGLIFGGVNSIALLWELAEWMADHLLGTHCQLGLGDTLLDLLLGMLGGLLYLLPQLVRAIRGSGTPVPGTPPP